MKYEISYHNHQKDQPRCASLYVFVCDKESVCVVCVCVSVCVYMC